MKRFEPTPPQPGELIDQVMWRLFDEVVEHYNAWLAEREPGVIKIEGTDEVLAPVRPTTAMSSLRRMVYGVVDDDGIPVCVFESKADAEAYAGTTRYVTEFYIYSMGQPPEAGV